MRTNMSEHGGLVIYQIINSPIVTGDVNAITSFVRSIKRMIPEHVVNGVFAKKRDALNHFCFYFWRKFTRHLIETFMEDYLHNELRWSATSPGLTKTLDIFLPFL